MRALRVLITNTALASFAGTETYVRDLALGLLRRGHTPILYSPVLGDIARELRAATVPVVDDLRAIGIAPDVIHGNQNQELMVALLHFPNVPAVFFCHGWLDWINEPFRHPRILKYVAVDRTCCDRLICEHALPEERVLVLLNAVDLERFKPRRPLPPRPRRALVFSNYASESTYLGAVREACARSGIALEVIGSGVNAASGRPESLLGKYDLVFAKARCALESLAVGASVILCDARGCGPLVTTNDLENLRQLNFGIRALRDKVEPGLLAREIARYDSQDAAEVTRRIRAAAGLEGLLDHALALYGEVIAEHERAPAPDPLDEARAAAAYLHWLTLTMKKDQAQMADSLTLRLMHRATHLPLLRKPLSLLARLARAKHL